VEKAALLGVQSEVVGSIPQSAMVLSRKRLLERGLFQIRIL
jgi:hypothetical protein